MLQSLTISNYALIDRLEFAPSEALSIITGETGAGKSILLGAVGLLLGKRADTRVLLDTSKKCVIEGEFGIGEYNLKSFFDEKDLDYDIQTIIRREISPAGKSRAFVNDTPVNLEVLTMLGQNLMDIHSQNDTQLLGSSSFQLKIVDAFSDSLDLFDKFQNSYQVFIAEEKRYNKLLEEEAEIRREFDFNNFLLDELLQAKFEENEQELLEEQQDLLTNSEEIKIQIHQGLDQLSRSEYSIITGMESLVGVFRQLSKFSGRYQSLLERTESALIELKDIHSEMEASDEEIEHDPQRISEIQERLSLLYHLQQKHQAKSIEELLKIQINLEEKVARFHSLDEELKQTDSARKRKLEASLEIAKSLSKKRQGRFEALCTSLQEMLQSLGMPDVQVLIEHIMEKELGPNGIDTIRFLFSANKGIAPQPLKSVASGGEFSRLMFCIKYLLAHKTSLPTMIFDEIDTGVSGEIALQLGNMMKEMAVDHQVIAITHLPQIAGKAERHFFVFKDQDSEKAVSKIRMLSESDRVKEIAKMIAGDNPSDSAFASAKELLDI